MPDRLVHVLKGHGDGKLRGFDSPKVAEMSRKRLARGGSPDASVEAIMMNIEVPDTYKHPTPVAAMTPAPASTASRPGQHDPRAGRNRGDQ